LGTRSHAAVLMRKERVANRPVLDSMGFWLLLFCILPPYL
jgi:hypothetical protein